MSEDKIVATRLTGQARLEALPAMFGHRMGYFEALVYEWMATLADEYDGGYWEMYLLSNGGFYMALASKSTFAVSVDGNGFSGELTADAAGVVVCLFALNQLAWSTEEPAMVDLYYALREFAACHPEARLIFQAID